MYKNYLIYDTRWICGYNKAENRAGNENKNQNKKLKEA